MVENVIHGYIYIICIIYLTKPKQCMLSALTKQFPFTILVVSYVQFIGYKKIINQQQEPKSNNTKRSGFVLLVV